MTPLEDKLILIGVDIVSDLFMDLYWDMKNKGQETISAEEILTIAGNIKNAKQKQIDILKQRLNSSD